MDLRHGNTAHPVEKCAPPAWESVPPIQKNHRQILLAVSGGGDSVAMLSHFLTPEAANADLPKFHVATVDHGLRPESANEAKFVAELAGKFGAPHSTLKWTPPENASSEDARLARHDLLTRHALDIGATAIAFAHTLDDQAETIMMRATRMTPESGTRGLAGIPPSATHAIAPDRSVCLVRPFLRIRRSALRQYLRDQNINWIDDPGNDDLSSERIRMRQALTDDNTLPQSDSIADFAKLSSRTRHWLNLQTSQWLQTRMAVCADGSLKLDAADAPAPVIENAIATLITVAGGLEHRPTPTKTKMLVEAFANRTKLRHNVGRALVSIGPQGAHFQREARNAANPAGDKGLVDGRFFVGGDGEATPFIKSLEQFRPQCDDMLHEIIRSKLGSMMPPNADHLL